MIEGFRNEYQFLSNFYPCDIYIDGFTFRSVEHYYVFKKFKDSQYIDGVFYDVDLFRELIMNTESPGKVKKIGKNIVSRSNFKDIRIDIMKEALRVKFNIPHFKNLLLETGDEYIVESNNWCDNYFGSCICYKCDNNGKNMLGKLLMEIRNEINGKKVGFEI